MKRGPKTKEKVAQGFWNSRRKGRTDFRSKAIASKACRIWIWMCDVLVREERANHAARASRKMGRLVVYLPAIERVSRWQSRSGFKGPLSRFAIVVLAFY